MTGINSAVTGKFSDPLAIMTGITSRFISRPDNNAFKSCTSRILDTRISFLENFFNSHRDDSNRVSRNSIGNAIREARRSILARMFLARTRNALDTRCIVCVVFEHLDLPAYNHFSLLH